MKTLAGVALGFAMMPATFGLIAAFAWAGIYFNLSRVDCALGALLGIVTALAGFLIAVKMWS